jgi:hypothetical protein
MFTVSRFVWALDIFYRAAIEGINIQLQNKFCYKQHLQEQVFVLTRNEGECHCLVCYNNEITVDIQDSNIWYWQQCSLPSVCWLTLPRKYPPL